MWEYPIKSFIDGTPVYSVDFIENDYCSLTKGLNSSEKIANRKVIEILEDLSSSIYEEMGSYEDANKCIFNLLSNPHLFNKNVQKSFSRIVVGLNDCIEAHYHKWAEDSEREYLSILEDESNFSRSEL